MTVSAEEFLTKVVDVSRAIGWQAGEPEMETAGLLISILHNHQEWIPRFMAEGTELFIDVGLWAELGSLNWRAKNGNIVSPEELFEHIGRVRK